MEIHVFHLIGKIFSHHFFKCYFFPFLSFPSAIPIMCMLEYLMKCHKFFKICFFFFTLFSFCTSNCLISIVLSSSLLFFLLPALLLNPSSEFLVQLLYFSALEFIFSSFLYCQCLTDTLYFLIHCPPCFNFFGGGISLSTVSFRSLISSLCLVNPMSALAHGCLLFSSCDYVILSCIFVCLVIFVKILSDTLNIIM